MVVPENIRDQQELLQHLETDNHQQTPPPESPPATLSVNNPSSITKTPLEEISQERQRERQERQQYQQQQKQHQQQWEQQQELQQQQQHPKERQQQQRQQKDLSTRSNGQQKNPHIPLQFVNNTGPILENSPDESGRVRVTSPPLVPGGKLYSHAVDNNVEAGSTPEERERIETIERLRERRNKREAKTLIFASSITRDIIKQTFQADCPGVVKFHEFRGKTAKNILKYMLSHVLEECPRTVVLVAGGNDMPNRDLPASKIKEIVDYMIEGSLDLKNRLGVENVLISSVLPRKHSDFQGNRHRLNKMLKEMCESNGLVFIDNNDIVLREHVSHDGVHLNCAGTNLLRDNLLHAVKNTT